MTWGTNAAGQTWVHEGGTGADFGPNPGQLTLTTPGTNYLSYLPPAFTDTDMTVMTSVNVDPTGDWIVPVVIARKTGGSYVEARLELKDDGTHGVAIREAGSWKAGQVLGTTPPAGTWYKIRLQVKSAWARVKVWTADAEPDHWQLYTALSTVLGAGSVGLAATAQAGNTNANPVVTFAKFSVPNPQLFTVTRSANGVEKAQTAGTAVSLAHPSVLAL